MRLLTGTSGFSYKPWKGPFYPEKMPDRELLGFYARQLPAVEINNTFYRMPKAEVLERWAEQVPEGFVFVIKASQRITHKARLKDAGEHVDYLWRTVASLGDHLGPILFQLPPYLKKDVPRLRDFLAELPAGLRPALEFRHDSWDDDQVNDVLRDAGAARCLADTDSGDDPALVPTASWGYLRLRKPDYDDDALHGWARRIAEQGWNEAFAFFKHEDEGAAPRLARRLAELFAAG